MSRMTLFRLLLQQRHLTTYASFAAQFERAAAELAERDQDPRLALLQVSSRQFDRWLGGELQTLPRPDTCRVLEYLLGKPASELFAAAPDMPETPQRVPLRQGEPHREAPYVTTPQTAPESPLEIVARCRQLTTGNADRETLAFLGSSLESVVARYEQDGPQALRTQTRSLRQLAHTLLDGHQPPRVRQELFRIAARAAGLLGYMAVNTSDFALAEAYCTEARELSRAIDDEDIEMWASGTLSLGFYYAGRYAEADACAAAAVNRAPRSAQSIRLLVNGRARALAKMGQPRAVDHVVGQALELSELHDVPVGITPCISFEPYGYARTLANAVTAHVSLGNVDQVLRDAQEIDDRVEHSDSSWSRSLVRLDVSTALLQQRSPDLDRAMSLGKEALALCGDSPITSVWQRARDLSEQAGRWWNEPVVREYGEELRTWSSQPAALAMSRSRAV
ncbi:hypothetical protein ACWEWX_01200 [Streptomyces asiaticus]